MVDFFRSMGNHEELFFLIVVPLTDPGASKHAIKWGLMNIFRHYLTLILFAAGLLLGLQAPNFVDQYERKIDAHMVEAKEQLVGYFEISDRFDEGDIHNLEQPAGYEDNTERSEHRFVKRDYERLQRLELEKGALRSPLAGKVIHILLFAERLALRETIRDYSASVALTAPAIYSGLLGGLVACVIFELLYGSVVMAFRCLRERKSRWDGKNPSMDI